jgi:pSer/pThr/pTyr-binding forkhead associated (FHA) protein
VTVPDASETANPILEIRANDSSLLNLQGLDINRYARIMVESSDQAVVNVLPVDGRVPDVPPSGAAAPPTNHRLIVQLPLEEHRELQRLMPHGSVRRSAAPLDAASLVFDDGRRIQLVTRASVVMGRDRSELAPSDIMLRLFPLDDDRWRLSRLISRQHVRFSLCPEGLAVEDCGATCGTYLDGRRLTESQILSPSASWWPQRHSVDVAGVLGLDITLHHDRGWDEWASCSHTGESYYAAVAGCDSPLLWHRAAESRIDAVRVCRRDSLPVARYLDQLKQILVPGHSEQWESVKCAAEAIERIDKLASREQYVFVYRTAELGGADEAAIRLSGLGLNDVPARILNLGGGFWLEGLTSETAAFVNGRPVAKRELVPLAPGDRLCFGGTELTFGEFQQVRA